MFSLERARLLDWIVPTVEHPFALLADRGNKLYISRKLPRELFDGYQMVVLRPTGRGEFTLSSAYPLTPPEFAAKRRQLRPTTPLDRGGRMRKATRSQPVFFPALEESAQLRALVRPPVPTARVTGEAVNHPESLTWAGDPSSQDTAADPYYRCQRGQGDVHNPGSLTRVCSPDSQDTAAGPYYQRQRGQGVAAIPNPWPGLSPSRPRYRR
ncbi:MAG: hypothetical protein ACREVE_10480 [Gammaproteobacteria bacterium]